MAHDIRIAVALAFGLTLLAACAGAPPAARATGSASTCVVTDTQAVDMLTVAVQQPVRPGNAPIPRNAAEQLVFGQLYETLVRIDCEGRALPALAESWTTGHAGRTWEFALRDGATFSDGAPVTAAAVIEGWSTTMGDSGMVGITGATVVGRGLRVELTAGVDVAWFARAELAVVRRSGGGWPHGTAAFQVRAVASRESLLLDAVDRGGPLRLQGGSVPSTIDIRALRTGDLRVALDAGLDLLLTTDPATLEYARALGGYTIVPSGWTRTYVLASRPTLPPAERVPEADAVAAHAGVSGGVIADLALHATARAAESPFWWSAAGCRADASPPAVPPPATGARAARLVAYPRDDATARAIAERIAALAWPVTRSPDWLTPLLTGAPATAPPVTEGLTEEAMFEALRTGSLLAAILPVPRTPLASCTSAALTSRPAAAALLHSGWRVTPLIDVQQHLLYRRPPGHLVTDADGTLRLGGGEP
jgi:hypothetical protein